MRGDGGQLQLRQLLEHLKEEEVCGARVLSAGRPASRLLVDLVP